MYRHAATSKPSLLGFASPKLDFRLKEEGGKDDLIAVSLREAAMADTLIGRQVKCPDQTASLPLVRPSRTLMYPRCLGVRDGFVPPDQGSCSLCLRMGSRGYKDAT